MKALALGLILTHITASSFAQAFGSRSLQPQTDSGMFARTYKFEPNAFKTMRRLVRAPQEISDAEVLQIFSKRKGTDLSPPSTLSYRDSDNLLVVRSTSETLDRVEQILESIKPKIVNPAEVDSKSVRLTAMDAPQQNVYFKYVSKPPQEIRAMAKRHPDAPVLVIKDGAVLAEAIGCVGLKQTDTDSEFVGLVLVFDNPDEARRAETALREGDKERQRANQTAPAGVSAR